MKSLGEKVVKGLIFFCITAVFVCSSLLMSSTISSYTDKDVSNDVTQNPVDVYLKQDSTFTQITDANGNLLSQYDPFKINIGDVLQFTVNWSIDDLTGFDDGNWFEFNLPSDYFSFTSSGPLALNVLNTSSGLSENIGTYQVIQKVDEYTPAKIRIELNNNVTNFTHVEKGFVTVTGTASNTKAPGDEMKVGNTPLFPIGIEPVSAPGFADKESFEKYGGQLNGSNLVNWSFSINYDTYKPAFENRTIATSDVKKNVILIDELPDSVTYGNQSHISLAAPIYALDENGALTTYKVADEWNLFDMSTAFNLIPQSPSDTWSSFQNKVKTQTTPSYGIFQDSGDQRSKLIFNFRDLNGTLSSPKSLAEIETLISNDTNLSSIQKTKTIDAYRSLFTNTGGTGILALELYVSGVQVNNNMNQTIYNKADLNWDSGSKIADREFDYFEISGGGQTGDPGSVTIKKLDFDTSETLDGAKFKLQKKDAMGAFQDYTPSDGASIRETDLSGIVVFKSLNFGTYRVVETQAPVGYTSDTTYLNNVREFVINGTEQGTIFITAKNPKIKTSISGTKTWNDANNQDGVRPASITIRLYADGNEVNHVNVDATSGWTYTFANLPMYKKGTQIVYTVKEDAVANYTSSQSGTNFTNTHIPDKTRISVTKVWNDNNNVFQTRPNNILVQLYANNLPYGMPVQLSNVNSWSFAWTNLDKNKNGNPITYTLKELNVPYGYQVAITENTAGSFVITNTFDPQIPSKKVTFKPSNTVSTSDNTNLHLYYGLLFIASSVIALKAYKKYGI